MTKIRVIISVHYKFDTSKKIKGLVIALIADDNFTCQNYRKITKQSIFTDLSVANMFLIPEKLFSCGCHNVKNIRYVFSDNRYELDQMAYTKYLLLLFSVLIISFVISIIQ